MVQEGAVEQAGAMTETPTGNPAGPEAGSEAGREGGPRVSAEEVRDLSRLRRSSTDKHVAGVAGGLGRHLDIDPVILRVAFVVFTFFGGAGLVLYGGLWLLVPRDDEPSATVDFDQRTRGAALVGVGIIAALLLLSDLLGGGGPEFWVPIPLAVIALVTWLVLSRRQRRRESWAAYWAGQGDEAGPVPPPSAGPITPPSAPPRPHLPPPPRDPRKRGPLLFWITLPLIALALGVLGMLDVGGMEVADSAYPALALGTVATMLVLGAFWGRAGGLIALGLIATVATAGATAAEHWHGSTETHRPATAAQVEDEYWLDSGELTVDLTEVVDLTALDGRHIEVGAGTGRVEVIVPAGLDVQVDAEVGGPGEAEVFGEHGAGLHTDLDNSQEGGPNAPDITLDVFVGVGEILVTNP